jgi:hypothetical protein
MRHPLALFKRYRWLKQTTFASTGFELVTKRARKREFLEKMNLVVPWADFISLMSPMRRWATHWQARVPLVQYFAHSLNA